MVDVIEITNFFKRNETKILGLCGDAPYSQIVYDVLLANTLLSKLRYREISLIELSGGSTFDKGEIVYPQKLSSFSLSSSQLKFLYQCILFEIFRESNRRRGKNQSYQEEYVDFLKDLISIDQVGHHFFSTPDIQSVKTLHNRTKSEALELGIACFVYNLTVPFLRKWQIVVYNPNAPQKEIPKTFTRTVAKHIQITNPQNYETLDNETRNQLDSTMVGDNFSLIYPISKAATHRFRTKYPLDFGYENLNKLQTNKSGALVKSIGTQIFLPTPKEIIEQIN